MYLIIKKYLLMLGCLVICFILLPGQVIAVDNSYASVVHPLRGNDFWEYEYSILETPRKQYEVLKRYNLPATWLVRYDALQETEVINFLRSLDAGQEIGLFLEVTPSLTTAAGVKYNESPNWHFAKSVLLTGYSPEDRRKLIDTAVSKYQELFNRLPKSVGAWWIDANSLSYLREKYKIEVNLDVTDQFSTDQYQVWGQYFSTPFYPSKLNALFPAATPEQKIGVVTVQWATRDPYNAYGSGVYNSTYSVQVNDYFLHDLNETYFAKLLDIYTHVVVGLENDFDWQQFGTGYTKQLEILSQKHASGNLRVQNMSQYASTYRSLYPNISPDVIIVSDDPLGGEGKVLWYQNSKYRIGWFYDGRQSVIRDLRLYQDGSKEPCYEQSCEELNLATAFSTSIDEIHSGTKWILDEGKITDFRTLKVNGHQAFSYKNQAGHERVIKLLPNDIEIDGRVRTITTAILEIQNLQTEQTQQLESDQGRYLLNHDLGAILGNFAKYLVLSILFFVLPGFLITNNKFLMIPIGWVVFTLLAYVSGILNLTYLVLWVIPIISLILILKNNSYQLSIPKIDLRKAFLITLILIGSLVWMLTTYKNGLLYNYGFGYWGPNGHDGIWHLSLISQLQKNTLPQNPIFAGEKLTNYHYFYDLLVAKSGQLLNIDNQDLFFRFFPLFISILSGVLIFKVVEKLSSYVGGLMAVFFLYFGGSFGWLVSYFRDGHFGGESMFWSQQAISTLLNPPFAISLLLFLSGFYRFIDFDQLKGKIRRKKLVYLIMPIILAWGTLIEFKAYGGVLVLAALTLVTIERVIFKRDFKLFYLLIPCGILSMIVFLPNLGGSALFVFEPLWLISTMITFQDRLNWYRLALALESGVNYKVVLSYLIGIVIFILGNLGTRIISLVNLKQIFELRILVWMALLGIMIPLLFVQKGNNWNVVQFFYYSLFIFNIFAAISLAWIFKHTNKVIGLIIVFCIVLLTIPTTLNTLNHYLPQRPPAKLSVAEYEGLKFLSRQPSGVVLSLEFNENFRPRYTEPFPLFAYASTAYISAFSGQEVFLEDTINLEILGIDYKGRVNLQRDFVRLREKAARILKDNNISYVYVLKDANFQEDEGAMGIKKIFENSEVKIFKVL